MTGTVKPPTATWRAVSASRRGSSHGPDVANQDAVRCEPVTFPDGSGGWVAAVADGHGGARYVRSEIGARTAVDVAVEAVGRALAAGAAADSSALLRGCVREIVAAWRDAVRAHADAHPFTPGELARGGLQPPGPDGLTAYGATLLVAVVGEGGVAVAQVGDGDALVRSHGFATRPVPGDARLVAGETTSLCLDSAVDDFRYAVLPATAEPDLVLLATDGYGNSFAQADWWHALLGDVASFVTRFGFAHLEQHLPDWLEESARVGGDDVTAVLIVRDPLAVAPPATSTPGPRSVGTPPRTLDLPVLTGAAPSDDSDSGRPRRRGHSRRRLVAVLAALAAVTAMVGAVALAFVLGGDPPPPPTGPPSSPTSTTPSTGDPSDDAGGRDDRGDRPGGTGGSSAPSKPQKLPDEPGGVGTKDREPDQPQPGQDAP